MENIKLVDFDKYCEKCEYSDRDGTQHPCNSCLTVPARENSHKPINYKKK